MKTKTILISMLFLLGLIAAGCSSDDGDGTPEKDTGPVAEASTPDPDGGADMTKPADDMTKPADDMTKPADDMATPAGKCMNADDGALLDTEEKRDGITAKAKDCGLGCLADADKAKCAAACVAKDTGLSEGCAGCYADVILCSAENCLLQCAADPDAADCLKCQEDNKCIVPTFYDCSGLPQS